MNNLLRHVTVFLWVAAALGRAQSTGHGSSTDSSIPQTTHAPFTGSTISSTVGLFSTNSTGTCPSRTVNYITHTLVRQCLRTDRAPSNGTYHAHITTNSTGAFASTVSPDQRPQEIVATYTVLNGTTTIVAETTSSGQHEPSPAHVSNSPTASAASDTASVPRPSVEEEEADSALDNANFLSFEDWKKQNLAKSGQSPDDVGRTQTTNAHRPRPVNNALDTLGDEQEIDIDFVGFGGVSQSSLPGSSTAQTEAARTSMSSQPISPRSKDAGKTCKERTNYASFDCAATVLKNNKEAKSATSVLVESKDSYMLNKCAADNKFLIVELCNDIQIDTIVLANYEFFSSGFRHFRLSVSDRYPVKMEKWRDLGTFEARNTREIQAFLIENPQIWARYLRIEFLTHYGSEYYCPVSLLRVHGVTMMEDYRHQEELARGEVDDITLDTEVLATPPIHQEPVESTDEASKSTEQAIPPVTPAETERVAPQDPTEEDTSCPSCTSNEATVSSSEAVASSLNDQHDNVGSKMAVGVYEPTNANMTCGQPPTPEVVTSSSANLTASSQSELSSTFISTSSRISDHANTIAPTTTMQKGEAEAASTSSSTSHGASGAEAVTSAPVLSANSTSNATATPGSSDSVHSNTNNQTAAASDSTRHVASSASSPPPAQPSTQESFFKSVHKRLLQLESNSTLSLQYIEEQSRILREAFSKVEKRQVATTNKFLSHLNETVMAELHGFRQAYDQLWQSTVIELENQRETHQREMLALSSRLTMVADELVWQKRMGIVQSALLLMCLALVLFGRSNNGALEVPLMQQLLNKSTTALSGWDTPPSPPSPERRSPVSLFRRKLWRTSTAPPDPQYASDDGGGNEGSRPITRESPTQPAISVAAPSPPRGPGAEADEWEDEEGQSQQEDRLSLDPVGRSSSVRSGGPWSNSSPSVRKKRKGKRFGLEGVMRLGNGIRSAAGQERARSPLANGDWQ